MTQSQDSILDCDALLAETSGRAEGEARSGFPVEIPEWVPPNIKRFASEHYGDPREPPEFNAIVVRLTTDARMRTVWTYLTRRKRDGHFFQPARGDATSDPDKQQERALFWLFLAVLEVAHSRPRVQLRREVEEARKKYRALASEAWATADMLRVPRRDRRGQFWSGQDP